MGLEVALVQLAKPLDLPLLPAKELNDSHSGYSLLKECVDAREARADVAVCIANVRPKPVRDARDERNHDERRECQPPIHDQHRDPDREERKKISQSRDYARRKKLIQGLDVRRHARYQTARRIAIEERNRESLKMREDFHSEIAHHALAEQSRQHRLAVRAEELGDEREGEENRHSQNRARIALRKGDVYHLLREKRAGELERPLYHQEQERRCDEPLVGRQVGKQPPHETRVVCFRERVFFVQGCGARHRAIW